MANGSDSYFSSYENLTVHELMLHDKPRTLAFANFINNNKFLFEGKVVLDVGAGCGILSLFAARAGASKVFAVEASSMATICQNLVYDNEYCEVIDVIHSPIEYAELPCDKVDVIISEWMGFYLLHESMIKSVIFARDKWLDPVNGIMVPHEAKIMICPVSTMLVDAPKPSQWENFYGFNFSKFGNLLLENHLSKPSIATIDMTHVLSDPETLSVINMKYIDADDVSFIKMKFNFSIKKNSVLRGFACWFECTFGDADSDLNIDNVTLDTGPNAESTHWKQTVIPLPSHTLANEGENIRGDIELVQDKEQPRRYNITVSLAEELLDIDESGEDDEEQEDEAVKMMLEAMGQH